MSSDVMEFGFDDGKVVQVSGYERFTQSRPGELSRISVISFKKHVDAVLKHKAKEKGSPLTDEEIADIVKKVDVKLAERMGKDVKDLTEVDRLNIESPKFAAAYTHFGDGFGTIRCLSKRDGKTITHRAVCCSTKKLDDAQQHVGCVILKYPIDEDGEADLELLNQKKYTTIELYRMSAKKYKKFESTYASARKNDFKVIDIKVTLDGDSKYQKQNFENGMTAAWARKEGIKPEIRQWILEEGLRAWKHVEKELGFELTAEQLQQRISGGGSSNQLGSGEASAEAPKLQQGYDDLL